MSGYFANLAGKSKESWNSKLKWVNENIQNILSIYYNDKNKFVDLIKDLDEPFQFVSMMFAMENLILSKYINNENYICENPILFDASCNGIQHY